MNAEWGYLKLPEGLLHSLVYVEVQSRFSETGFAAEPWDPVQFGKTATAKGLHIFAARPFVVSKSSQLFQKV